MSEAIIQLVEPKGDHAAILNMTDGTKVWTPEKAKADALLGKPIPADWTVRQGDYGPQAFPPKEKGFGGKGPTAWRNTEAGAKAEQRSIHASVALTQAVAATVDPSQVLPQAEKFFAWLTDKTSGEPKAVNSGRGAVHATPDPTVSADQAPANQRSPETSDTVVKGAVSEASTPAGTRDVGKVPTPGGECSHLETTHQKPDGRLLPLGRQRCLDCGAVI